MSKKAITKASETEAPPATDTGMRAALKHAKDFVMDKLAHPGETAGEVKEWAERSAEKVDAALDGAQATLAAVNSSLGQARAWTADRATQADRVLAGAQSIVTQVEESVQSVQDSTKRVGEALEADAAGEAPPTGTGASLPEPEPSLDQPGAPAKGTP